MKAAVVAGVLILGSAGLASGYYFHHQQVVAAQRREAAQRAAALKKAELEQAARLKAARDLQRRAKEKMARMRGEFYAALLTGRSNGVAEWVSGDGRSRCGVNPTHRYYIVRNDFGTNRVEDTASDTEDRQFESGWKSLECEIAAPVNQAKLLRIREQQEQVKLNRRWCFMFYQEPKLRACLKDAERPDFH